MTGRKSRSHPPKATKQPGVVLSMFPRIRLHPVYPPSKSLNQMQDKGRIKNMAIWKVNTPPIVKYAIRRYAIATTTEMILPIIILTRKSKSGIAVLNANAGTIRLAFFSSYGTAKKHFRSPPPGNNEGIIPFRNPRTKDENPLRKGIYSLSLTAVP